MIGVPQRLLDDFVALAAPDLDLPLRRSIEEFAPPPPFWLGRGEGDLRRWAAASLTAAAVGLDQSPGDPAEVIRFAFGTARLLYCDPAFTA
jgi:hypothetical protein